MSADFPEQVDSDGKGWYYCHIKSVIRFVKANPDKVSKSAYKKCENLSASFTAQWKKRVRQLQVPIFALNTKGAWTLRFDDIIAEVFRYYYANKQEYTDWVVLPVANFDAYYSNNNLSKKWLAKITKSIIRRENRHGVCRIMA